MLDLIITYFNFFILAIKFIVKTITFRPPNPKGYRIIISENGQDNVQKEEKLEILFLVRKPINEKEKLNKKKDVNDNKKETEYKLAPNNISNYQLIYIPDNENKTLIPAFLFKPKEINFYIDYSINDYLIIYCHGNSGDIGTSFIECQLLCRNLSCDVLCFEYPGYGLSKDINNINEKRSYINIRKAYEYAKNNLGKKPENIIIYGFSLGTGIAFDLACDRNYPTGGIILQSPFLSIIRTIYNFKKTYYFDIFNNCDKAKMCNSKIFFIHGNKDTIVPYVHGRILSKLIPKQFLYDFYTVDGANHNDILKFAKTDLYYNISRFIKSLIDENSDLELSSINSEYDYGVRKKITEKNKINNINDNTDDNNTNSDDKFNIKEKEKNYLFSNKKNNLTNNNENSKDTMGTGTKNEKSCNVTRNNEESGIEEPKIIDPKNIKITIDYYNMNYKKNDLNAINSNNELNIINNNNNINV